MLDKIKYKFVKNYFFLKNYVSHIAISHSVLYCQQLPITRYQMRFYDNHYFEAWLVEQKALPPKLYEAIMVKFLALGPGVTTWTRTRTLLIKHQSFKGSVH